jgi:myo-inositol-1(or 4)-monophosphatase
MRELLLELAHALRAHVLPALGSHAGRATGGPGAGGDLTFEIDRQAEVFLERFLRERASDFAFYSEDRGMVLPNKKGAAQATTRPDIPEVEARRSGAPAREGTTVLVVDPIDGTRPAMAGLESCCVSVAAAPLGQGRPTMGDVEAGCIVEIKSGFAFVAERGRGVQLLDGTGGSTKPMLSPNVELDKLFWSSGFRGRPADLVVEVLGELIDVSSVGGAFFDLGSATFDMTRLLTGQLDAYVDVGSMMIEEVPALRARFEQVGGGAVLNNSPYDLAAAVLCLQEAGAAVTDALGRPLDDRPLLGSGHDFQMSCLAAATPPLHSSLQEAVERGMERLLGRCG